MPYPKASKETHGIDALFAYHSPLESKTIENVIVSSKYSSNPYSSVPSTFKAHFEDIALAIECYNKSTLKKRLMSVSVLMDHVVKLRQVFCFILITMKPLKSKASLIK